MKPLKEPFSTTVIYLAVAIVFAALLGALLLGTLLSFAGGPDWVIYIGATVGAAVVVIVWAFQAWQRSWWDE